MIVNECLIVNANLLLNDWSGCCIRSISRLLSQQHPKYCHSFLTIFPRVFILFHFLEYLRFAINHAILHTNSFSSLLFVFSDITSSVKRIRNHVDTYTTYCPPTTAPLSLHSLHRLEQYLATDLHSFTRPPCLALPEVLLTLVR